MPTYEYKCHDCRRKFETFQSITEPSLTKCPQCGGRVERLISGGSGLLFKGSGFYITDYRSDSYKKDAGKEKHTEKAPAVSTAKDSKKDKTDKKSK